MADSPRHARTLITKGVYRDKSGVAIVISVNGRPKEYRRDLQGLPYKDRDKEWLKKERIRRQAAATVAHEDAQAHADTLAADIPRFLNTLSGEEHRLNMSGYMAHWMRLLGDRPRNAITPIDAQTAFAKIEKKPSTRRHIRRALVKFYEALNGKSGYNPAREIIAPPKPLNEARAIPYAVIEKIFAALVPSKARARLKVLAYVGLPHAQIAKLQPSDLRLTTKEVIVHPRRKGAGVEGRALPLSPAGVAALKEFRDLDAFGPFQTQQLVETFRLGAKRAQVALPENARPYDLRHSFLTEVYRQTGDLYAVSELGMHATLDQTARYAKGAASERATKAIASVPRFLTTRRRGNARNIKDSKGVTRDAPRPRAQKKKRKKP